MNTIYKYDFGRIQDKKTIEMPKGAEVFHAAIQYGGVYIWAYVDTEAETEERRFRIYSAGHPVVGDFCIDHVATLFQGRFVWHLVEELQ